MEEKIFEKYKRIESEFIIMWDKYHNPDYNFPEELDKKFEEMREALRQYQNSIKK